METRIADVNTKEVLEVRDAISEIYFELFPNGSLSFVEAAFDWVIDAFEGHYADYQAIDAKYHDFEHTLQGTLCFARLLHGYTQAGAIPELTQRMFELGLLAILLHYTGYLKKRGDWEGTGAKYTLVHVARSADFAAALLRQKGFPGEEIRAVQNMIRCTGVNANLNSIPFQSELERRVGFALGTADLVGQMAADDYIEKLGILFLEFEESNRYNNRKGGPEIFASAADLRRRTPLFWSKYVLPKINSDFLGMHKYLAQPYPDGPNEYLQRVEANIARLERELAAAA
jgi:hypothetical protein